MDEREKRIQKIVKLYNGEVPEETIRNLSKLFPLYGGTVIGKLVLDLYDSLVYDETPKGPKGKHTI